MHPSKLRWTHAPRLPQKISPAKAKEALKAKKAKEALKAKKAKEALKA